MRKNVWKVLAGILLGIMTILFVDSSVAYADTGTVRFGSESYEYENGEIFPIGVYINGDETIGTYYVELAYDVTRMEYVSGAEKEENGIIILEGTATGDEVRYMLQFEALSGGEAYIEIKYVKMMTADSNNKTQFDVNVLEDAPIILGGEDVAIPLPKRLPTIGSQIVLGNETYYLLDLAKAELDENKLRLQKKESVIDDEVVTTFVNNGNTAKYVYLVDSKNELCLYGYCEEDGKLYSCEETKFQGKTYYLTNARVATVWPEKLSLALVNREAVYYGIDEDGNGGFYQILEDGTVKEWTGEDSQDTMEQQIIIYTAIGCVVALVVLLMITGVIIRGRRRRKSRRHGKSRRRGKCARYGRHGKYKETEYKIINLNDENDFIEDENGDEETSEELNKEEPIISVQNVTMEFKVSTSNASGIKEYIIQLLKRQIAYREFKALDNVSFDIYKGEIVGIIGTNGSGKSTILRIVSGALKPTSGNVKVDTKKIQLLTLGTGFDMELTARENVYLNGAIIGLSKEFLDEHYQEIVEFAELEGFMEEKVKNFSSGMVSRLGFAIATVGEVSEILILDEVLSVGDEFFRKKSLKKVKEMIHSGSTVLMVSHSAQTIIDNCTKAIWIERGKLRKVGSPKSVCWAYKKSQIEKDEK